MSDDSTATVVAKISVHGNPQELFDKVVNGLRRQGYKRSVTEGGGCAYRGTDGMKCAAGLLIPDEEYSINMEYLPCRAIMTFDDGKSTEVVSRLQAIHDNHAPHKWERSFNNLAIDTGLVYTPVKE